MKDTKKTYPLYLAISTLVIAATSNLALLWLTGLPKLAAAGLTFLLVAAFSFLNVVPGKFNFKNFKFNVLSGGCLLLTSFCIVTAAETVMCVLTIFFQPLDWIGLLALYIVAVIVLAFVFWNGIIRIYLTSVQLGLKLRVIGVICGMIPIANLVVLFIMIHKVRTELAYEKEYEARQAQFEGKEVCATKYPVLMVHGVFFRDSKVLNYWGRIPAALEDNGAIVCYGQQQSALSVEQSAAELAEKIKALTEKYHCEKLNIIAHSKGGLDCRYAISKLGADKYVASLTTVNTPHRGCIFVENLFNKIPEKTRNKMARAYNATLKRIGDKEPDFLSAVADLRESACAKFNEDVPDSPDVFYQSIGSAAKNAQSGRFPLNVSYPMVRRDDGENDGLVATTSMQWGDNFRFVTTKGYRGVTHADMIDLNRENIPDFDVRSFYVDVVRDLKERGF